MEYSYQGDKYLYSLDFLYDNPSIVTLSVYDVETLEIVGNYDQDELPMEFPYPDWLPLYITAALE